MLFFLRSTRADNNTSAPKPTVAVELTPVLAKAFSPLATVCEVFWTAVFSASAFLSSLFSFCPKISCVDGCACSFAFCSLFNSLISNSGNSGWTRASPFSAFDISFNAGSSGWTRA